MPISPWPKGQTQPLTLTLAERTNSSTRVPQLNGATLSLRIVNVFAPSQADIVGNGAFGALDLVTGIVTYTWGTNEPVSTPGTYDVYVDATFTGPPYKRTFGPLRWVVM